MSTVVELKQPSIAEHMMRLFPASRRAHATYNPDQSTHTRRADGKLAVTYWTVRKPVTIHLWEGHLAGKHPLVLGLACDDGTSGVSVVDVDQYDIDSITIVLEIKARKLPFYVRRSKSGGAHVCAFHDVLIPMAEATAVAEGMARCLGLTKVEYFPKPQNPDPAILPKPLNMPYFGGAGGFIRSGSKVGDQLRVEEFVRSVVRLTAEQRAELARFATPVRKALIRQNKFDHVHNPVLVAMMEADAGKGVSDQPEDSFACMTVDELEIEMRFALSVIPADDYDLWFKIGAAIYDGLGDAGLLLFDEWSQECPEKYDPRGCERKWRDFRKIRSIRVETIFWHANQFDSSWRDKWRRYLRGEVLA